MRTANWTIMLPGQGGSRRIILSLDLDDVVQQQIAAELSHNLFYEHETSVALLAVLRPGDVVLDLGANVGFFTTLMSTLVGPEGRVIAFEPNPRNIERIKVNLEGNSLSAVIVPAAAGAARGEVRFRQVADNDSNGAIASETDLTEQLTTMVPMWTVDEVLAQVAPPRAPKLIKLDIEGAELEALRGATRLLESRSLEFVVCEINGPQLERFGASPRILRDFMASHGFETFLPHPDGALPTHVPALVEVQMPYVTNLLFARPEAVPRYWQQVLCLTRTGRIAIDQARASACPA